jgi:hypothetical protein
MFMGFLFGGTLFLITFPFQLLSVLKGTNIEAILTLGSIVLLSLLSIAIGVIGLMMKRRREVRHVEHLSRMPPGLIPEKQRAGHGDPEVKKKWKDATEKARVAQPFHGGIDPGPSELGLKGKWNFPIMSREERKARSEQVYENLKRKGKPIIAIGIMMLVAGVLCLWVFPVIIILLLCFVGGITLLLLESVFLIYVPRRSREIIERDDPAETRVAFKEITQKEVLEAIEGFLLSFGEGYETKHEKVKDLSWTHHQHKYVFSNQNYISIVFMGVGKTGDRMAGWLGVGYKPGDFLHARKIQKALDDFLVDRDLIMRAS